MARRSRWWLRIGIAVVLLGALLLVVAPTAAIAPPPPKTDWPPGPTLPTEEVSVLPAPVVPPGAPAVVPGGDVLAGLVPYLPPCPVPPPDGVPG